MQRLIYARHVFDKSAYCTGKYSIHCTLRCQNPQQIFYVCSTGCDQYLVVLTEADGPAVSSKVIGRGREQRQRLRQTCPLPMLYLPVMIVMIS